MCHSYGDTTVLKPSIVARSQFTAWEDFKGKIAVKENAPMTEDEWYATAVHEIGHMLGLQHSENGNSVTYYLDNTANQSLDADDLKTLRMFHQLRDTDAKSIPVLTADKPTQKPDPTAKVVKANTATGEKPSQAGPSFQHPSN